MADGFKRQVARKIEVSEIINGLYKRDYGAEPNQFVTKSGINISRINVVAIVVSKSKEGNFEDIILDDGSGKLVARSFEQDFFNGIDVGDFVMVIGKPREFGSEKYVLPEIVKKLPDSKWLEVRRKELKASDLQNDRTIHDRSVKKYEQMKSADKVLEIVRKLDSGDGADINELIRKGGDEKTINYLLQRGDVFQIRPGRLKALE